MKINKIFSIVLAVLIAFGMWFYVVTNITPEDSQWIRSIPVTFENEDGLFTDRNLTLTEGRNSTIDLKFYGNRQDLSKLTNSNVVITVDLGEITEPGEWKLRYNYQLPETVNASNITIEARSSFTVALKVDELATRQVPVQASFEGAVAEGYMAEPIELDRETIEISGPQEAVNLVSYAKVVLERTNLSKSVSDSLSYTLMDKNDEPVENEEIHCNVDKINVLMQVNMVKVVPLTVSIIEGGGASADHAVVNIDPSTVTIKGDAAELEGLNSISLGTVDISSIEERYTQNFHVIIPDNMENLTGDNADVTVELKNLKTKTFTVTNLEVSGKPENLRATLGTMSLQIKVRGDSNVIGTITANNIRAVADLSSLGNTTGQFNVPVDVYIDGFSDVGAMGTYTVMVSLSEPVAAEETAVEVSRTSTTEEKASASSEVAATASPISEGASE